MLRHDVWGIVVVGAVVLASTAPTVAGYLRAPRGWVFTGAPTYADDAAQHELWAREMAQHGRYLVNLLTPERTARGWFVNPLELLFGLIRAGMGISYPLLGVGLVLLVIPALAWGLMTLARSVGLPRPGVAVLVSLLAGSLAPLGVALAGLGLPANKQDWLSYGGDATPIFAGGWFYLTLAVLTLVALLSADFVSGYRRAGATLFVLGAVYPFFVPVLWLTGALHAGFQARSIGRKTALKGLIWFSALALPPALYYGVLLPHVDAEFARFARLNHRNLPSVTTAVVTFGLGGAALLGVPRLLRAGRPQQLLAWLSVAVLISLYIPQYPWRSHLFLLSPLLVLAALAAWWPVLERSDWKLRAAVVILALGATLPSTPYYYRRNVHGFLSLKPPQYLTSGDVAAMSWLARDHDRSVVLARSDISPWIAPRTGHRVVVGHYLWTRDWSARRDEVDAIFEGRRSPNSLLKTFDIQWILLDRERGVPRWAAGVAPTVQFGTAAILRAADVLKSR